MKPYWKFIRPFTLLVPAMGMVAGAFMALGAEPKWASDWSDSSAGIIFRIVAGAVVAAGLNAYSNGINQIYDLEVDRINKPHRMLPSGELGVGQAWGVSLLFLVLSLALSYWINLQCFLIVALATVLTFIYSAPPLRTKSRGVWANITIAIPRGTLLVVCGWSTVKSVLQPEPWWIGGIFGAFFLGAVTTKDFADIAGDRAGGCRTLPVIYGVKRSIWMISPFLVLPFLAILPGVHGGTLTGSPWLLAALGVLLPLWGLYITRLLIATPEGFFNTPDSENHPSWKHMYLLVLVAQVGLSAAYLIGG